MSSCPCEKSNKTKDKSEEHNKDSDCSSQERWSSSQDQAETEDFQKHLSHAWSISVWLELLSLSGSVSAVIVVIVHCDVS